jgi:hypothetical protein
VDKISFIFHLLHSISIHPDDILLFNKAFIPICKYFLNVVHFAHYYYNVPQFYSTIDQYFLPQLNAEQSSDQVEILRKQLDTLRSTPLKLSEITRKIIRMKINIPAKNEFQQLGFNKYLVEFLVQTQFQTNSTSE